MKIHTRSRNWLLVVIPLLFCVSAYAQKVELIYTAAGVNQALAYKEAMQLKDASATNALSLMNISDERKKAYLKNLAGTAVVVIFGDGGVKAVKAIEYPVPVIIVNSMESSSAAAGIVRVLDKDYKGSAAGSKTVTNPATLTKADISGHAVIKCDDGSAAVKKIISLLK